MNTITPECVQPIADDLLHEQVETGGLVPNWSGPELWDCTDERGLIPFHQYRRDLEFGAGTPAFAVAGAREGFALFDLVLRAGLDGERSLRRYEQFLSQSGTDHPFVAHSVRFAQDAQYGTAARLPSVVAEFDGHYGFFRRLKGQNFGQEQISGHRTALQELMQRYGAAVLNTHSDTHHEKDGKIRADATNNSVGCAHNNLVGQVSKDAANNRLIPAAKQVALLLGLGELPFETAQEGFAIVARNINPSDDDTYSVRRDGLVAEHDGRRKPADIILDGSHVPPTETSLIMDGARTARNTAAQIAHGMQTFMSNPVKAAERLAKISEFGENTKLSEATIILHALAVRNRLCGTMRQDSPKVLPVYVVTPGALAKVA